MTTDVSDEASLSARLVEYYRQVLETHANDPVLHTCPICKVNKCRDWRFAYERLVCAGVQPEGEGHWLDLIDGGGGQA